MQSISIAFQTRTEARGVFGKIGPLIPTTTFLKEMVGATGFEPATSWSQTKCSTRLSYAPTRPRAANIPQGSPRANVISQRHKGLLDCCCQVACYLTKNAVRDRFQPFV